MDEELVARLLLAVILVAVGSVQIWAAGATATGRLTRNSAIGIRTRSTMSSDAAWLAAHQRAKRTLQGAGWAAIVGAVPALLPVGLPWVVGGVLTACLVMLILVIRAGVVAGRAARASASSAQGGTHQES